MGSKIPRLNFSVPEQSSFATEQMNSSNASIQFMLIKRKYFKNKLLKIFIYFSFFSALKLKSWWANGFFLILWDYIICYIGNQGFRISRNKTTIPSYFWIYFSDISYSNLPFHFIANQKLQIHFLILYFLLVSTYCCLL